MSTSSGRQSSPSLGRLCAGAPTNYATAATNTQKEIALECHFMSLLYGLRASRQSLPFAARRRTPARLHPHPALG
eukprot:scaffold5037_cov114-Isochrysis_galbana.AAC.16